jgi:hypothetical protein
VAAPDDETMITVVPMGSMVTVVTFVYGPAAR